MDAVPIVIDNGSYQCRAGFANRNDPQLVFRNYAAKLRKERGKKDVEILVGNEIENPDSVRSSLKSPFDRNVAIFMDTQENVLDYTFASLNLGEEDKIEHPILMSEAPLNPNYCRHLMTEVLFECYRVPAVSYGVDALHSFKKNFPELQDGLIVSFGHSTTHVIPYLNEKIDPINCRRILLGGADVTNFLQKLLVLKYPGHENFFTLGKAEELLHQHGYISQDYKEELLRWTDSVFLEKNSLKLESSNAAASLTSADAVKERRKELARKMIEFNARKREQKLLEDENRLKLLLDTKEKIDSAEQSEEEMQRLLGALEVTSFSDLLKQVTLLKMRIQKAKNRAKEHSTLKAPFEDIDHSSPEAVQRMTEWLNTLRSQRLEILKRRSVRRQRRTDMVKRKTAASQERMRILSQLAREEKNDKFGMRDEDWDIYKSIQKDAGGSDSEDDREELNEVEQTLKLHDPNFSDSEGSLVTDQELRFGLEKTRAPELLFQPSMVGETFTGVAETLEHVLKLYDCETQMRLASKIFLTGGPANYPGCMARLGAEVLAMRPFKSHFSIAAANAPSLDAWRGMQLFANSSNFVSCLLSRAEFDDKGGEYLKEHMSSNRYYPSPHMSCDIIPVDEPSPISDDGSQGSVQGGGVS